MSKVINKSYLEAQLKAMESQVIEKKYQQIMQVTALPEASADVAGKVFQFIGESTDSVVKGYFYTCIMGESAYEWKAMATQPVADEYSMAKDEAAEEGFAATYHLTKNGENCGVSINIPKDWVLKDVSLKTCEEADVPEEGYEVGDKYFDFEFNVKVGAEETSTHVYLKVNELVDVYTEGDGIAISESNEVSVKLGEESGLNFDEDGNIILEYESENIDFSAWE